MTILSVWALILMFMFIFSMVAVEVISKPALRDTTGMFTDESPRSCSQGGGYSERGAKF